MDDKEINEALKNVLELVEMSQERSFVSNAELFDQLITAYSSQLDTQFIPKRVSQDYAGLNLGKLYEDNDLKLLIKSFKHNQLLDAYYALKIIEDAQDKLAELPNIRECVITDTGDELGCIVVGDLHGNFNDLCHVMDVYGLPGVKYKYVFNGDFVDRGEKQLEVLLTVLYAFLIRPDRVFINRGNHEDISLNTSSHFKPNLMSTFTRKYGKYSAYLFGKSVNMFSYFPLATIIRNRPQDVTYFVAHGGISDEIDLEHMRTHLDRSRVKRVTSQDAAKDPEVKMVSDLLWSDPITETKIARFKFLRKNQGCHFNERRKCGCLFGVDVTEKFCKKNGFTAIIRSHEVRDKGYSEDHAKCLTIFSASCYCGGDNFGAIFKIEPNERQPVAYSYKTRRDQSYPPPGDKKAALAQHNYQLIKQFKNLIQSRQSSLMAKFEQVDVKKTGTIEIDKWAQIVSRELDDEISPEHLNTLKDFLCECESNLGVVNYMTMFKPTTTISSSSSSKSNKSKLLENPMNRTYLEIIDNLFDILDKNGDKKISLVEAQDALVKINEKLGGSYSIRDDCVAFIKNMDLNGDNMIDLQEFRRAFFELDDVDANNNTNTNTNNNSSATAAAASHSAKSHRTNNKDDDENVNSDDSEEGDLQIVRI